MARCLDQPASVSPPPRSRPRPERVPWTLQAKVKSRGTIRIHKRHVRTPILYSHLSLLPKFGTAALYRAAECLLITFSLLVLISLCGFYVCGFLLGVSLFMKIDIHAEVGHEAQGFLYKFISLRK